CSLLISSYSELVIGTKRILSPDFNKDGGFFLGENKLSGVRPIICHPPGVSNVYIPVCLPAITIDRLGMDGRGVYWRGVAIDLFMRTKYANRGAISSLTTN